MLIFNEGNALEATKVDAAKIRFFPFTDCVSDLAILTFHTKALKLTATTQGEK